ncbi:ATP-binding protein [Xanthobacter sediminis]|uniref:ATP-binding protein n=1 Tax=Xanthobacter sediminis TaxID=3119926 RepID=UPI00372B96A1
MRPLGRVLWPRSLAGRLVVLLVAALALAQLALVLLLRSEHDSVVGGIVRGQALSQTVALARLVATSPPQEAERLASAFGARDACAWTSEEPPPARPMTPVEQSLAQMLKRRLHGLDTGAPQVRLDAHGNDADCPGRTVGAFPWLPREGGGGDSERPGEEGRRHGGGVVALSVPIPDRGWLHFSTTVSLPGIWNRPTLLSFLVSALVVSAVTFACVRLQTRSLRALADASERFGRGESVPALPPGGPTEVAAATLAFNTMQQRLSLFMRDRMRLLAAISHDLRTPLTTLRLKAEFVEDPTVRDDIVATIDELAAICEATLAFTRAEATNEATCTVDLDALCAGVVEEFAGLGADAEMATCAGVAVACRPVALRRALRNLVDNAMRYGRRARVSTARAGTEQVAIQVDDAGPGLPEELLEDAFRPFVRLEPSRSAETGGMGLGLAIARSIVKAHGGELTLINRPEGGLRAHILLPVHEQAEA